jgi:cytochrome oxidase assembly protein ShyY1
MLAISKKEEERINKERATEGKSI